MKKISKALILIILIAAALAGGYFLGRSFIPKETITEENNLSKEEEISFQNKTKVDELLSEMTLDEMVYQMMFVTPESITKVGTVIQAGDATRQALEKYPVGGLVYFAKNFESREQTISMLQKTNEYAKIPLFLSVDEEGGRVARLGSNPSMGTTSVPAMKEIGNTKDSDKAYEVGKILADDLKALGFNTDFAPVADLLVNENNFEIGDRSFGSDPYEVSQMVKSAVSGFEENGISSTLKHFPGHGSTYTDSHTGYSESKRTIDELRANEFLPFKAGIDAGADFIMVSHMTLTSATEEKVPSSVSKEVITDMLITELGYEGIIITDSFSMGAVTDMYTPSEAAIKAISAGADMILMTPDLEGVHRAIIKAVEDGEIPKERIEKSVRKILTLKVEKGMIK